MLTKLVRKSIYTFYNSAWLIMYILKELTNCKLPSIKTTIVFRQKVLFYPTTISSLKQSITKHMNNLSIYSRMFH